MGFRLSPLPALLLVVAIAVSVIRSSEATNITITNDCKETIWPGIIANNNNDSGDGFSLKPGQSTIFNPPSGWGGRIWARTGCDFDKYGSGKCQTGGCGTSLKCSGPGDPPFSIAEFSLGGDIDYYDVSLVDGFNLPIVITPVKGKGNCSAAGCDRDLRTNCPPELAKKDDGKVVACQSACNVFNSDEYCCRGEHSQPNSCLPSNYSRVFKQACPVAYSYARDDPTSVVTCSSTDYVVGFCSSRNNTKQCTYHNKQLVCSGSEGLKAVLQGAWWMLMLAMVLPIITNPPIKS